VAAGVLSDAELAQLDSWPAEIAQSDLAAYFTLAVEDLRWLRSFRSTAAVRLGLAVQCCALGFLGFVPADAGAAPAEVTARLAKQVGVSPAALIRYGAETAKRSRREHVEMVVAHTGWRGPANTPSLDSASLVAANQEQGDRQSDANGRLDVPVDGCSASPAGEEKRASSLEQSVRPYDGTDRDGGNCRPSGPTAASCSGRQPDEWSDDDSHHEPEREQPVGWRRGVQRRDEVEARDQADQASQAPGGSPAGGLGEPGDQ